MCTTQLPGRGGRRTRNIWACSVQEPSAGRGMPWGWPRAGPGEGPVPAALADRVLQELDGRADRGNQGQSPAWSPVGGSRMQTRLPWGPTVWSGDSKPAQGWAGRHWPGCCSWPCP